jgi:macrolide-specific efflux system membrane fusion protein
MSFLQRLARTVRRIPPLMHRASLLLPPPVPRAPAQRRMSRPALVVNAVLVALLIVGLLLAYRTVTVADTASDSGTARTGVVTKGPVAATVSAIGTVQSGSMANLSFAASGTVTELDVKVGDAVKKDQVLAKISSTQAQEQLSAAQATLASAQQSLTRIRSTTSDAATIAFAQAQVTTAQNSVNAARRAVDGTTLTAPIDGTVVAVNGTVGAWWNPAAAGSESTVDGVAAGASNGNPFIQLADLAKLQVSTSVSEVDINKLKVDQPAAITWAALPQIRAIGRVSTIAPAATNQNAANSYPVTVSLEWLPDGVRIGQTVTVIVTVAKVEDAVRVPLAAVHSSESQYLAEVVKAAGKHETRAVEVGVQGDEFVQIKSGLTPGEQVALFRDKPRGNK